MLSLRNSHNPSELDELSVEITNNVVRTGWVAEARTICTYLHTGSEVRTEQIVDWALSRGKRVIVPITIKAEKHLLFSELRATADLEKGVFGIPEPRPACRRPVPLEEADVVLVPGIAWDTHGYRIGYGGGYYDRSLNSIRKHVNTIGLAFEFQMITDLPRIRYDRHVDKIVTEQRTIDVIDSLDS
jgi:5-formyltetrahydrofolate cyclo-ligase